MMTTNEAAAAVRRALKSRIGAGPRQISVRSSKYSMGSTIIVEIKVAGIGASAVQGVVDDLDGVACGGSRFVSVSYAESVRGPVYDRIHAAIDGCDVSAPAEGIEVCREGSDTYTIYTGVGTAPATAYGLGSAAHQVTAIVLDRAAS